MTVIKLIVKERYLQGIFSNKESVCVFKIIRELDPDDDKPVHGFDRASLKTSCAATDTISNNYEYII